MDRADGTNLLLAFTSLKRTIIGMHVEGIRVYSLQVRNGRVQGRANG